MTKFAIGVDLGGTNLRIAAVDTEGKLLEKVMTQVAGGRDVVIREMTAAIRGLASRYGSSGELVGTGIGVPGILYLATGRLRESPNLPGWEDYPVREEIERQLGARVVLDNDANAAALGEQWLGAGRGRNDLCMLTLGTGVGGGIILGGRVWHGMTGMAAELGHITVEPQGPLCGCGSRGCVEQFASATAVSRMARESVASGRSQRLAQAASSPGFDAQKVFQLAMDGDDAAKEIFERVGWALGIVLAGLINSLNLPAYVIGGGLAAAWEAFSPALFREVRSRSYIYVATAPGSKAPGGETLITRAELGGDAGLYGAARLAMLQAKPAASG